MEESSAIKYFFNPAINDYFLERHDFKNKGCHAFFRKVTAEYFVLDDFRCDKHTKGEGRKLLLYGLEWLKTNFPNVKTISLNAVPSITFEQTDNLFDKQKKRELGQINLNKYYTNLGFNEDEEKVTINSVALVILGIEMKRFLPKELNIKQISAIGEELVIDN